jgi:hypothetical protein
MKKTLVSIAVILFLSAGLTDAHCDGEDGPVIISAKKALKENNVNLVLIWVQKKDEQEIIDAFNKAAAVRGLSAEAQEIADKYFFETLVRVHRTGEGASYTGIKPAGFNNDPSVLEADKTVAGGSLKDLYKILSDELHNGLHHAYDKVEQLKNYDKNDVSAGREFVAAYVNFLHYAERVYNAAKVSESAHEHH